MASYDRWVGPRAAVATGKTFFLEAIGQAAVEVGIKVAWFALEDLGVLVRRHRADDTVTRAVGRILRSELIVVDDIGLLPVSLDAAEGLYRLVDAAYERRSIAVSSNLHPSGFDELMPKTLASDGRPSHAPRPHLRHDRRQRAVAAGNDREGGEATHLRLNGRTHGRQRAVFVSVSARFTWPPARGTQWPLTPLRDRDLRAQVLPS